MAAPDSSEMPPPVEVAMSAPDIDAPEPIESSKTIPTLEGRKIIYTATIVLQVPNMRTTRDEIDRLIECHDGFIQKATLDRITFRVPPNRFESAMNKMETLGKVLERTLQSDDVTNAYTDMTLRLEVAEVSRQRLLELLHKSAEVKDVLEVERDIRRLTEEIERMKGQLRVLNDQVALATISVFLRQQAPVAAPRRRPSETRFSWMRQVGVDRIMHSVSESARLWGEGTLTRLIFGKAFQLDVPRGRLLPDGFIPLQYTGSNLIGTTPQDDRLRVQAIQPRQSGDLEFWGQALAQELAHQRGYQVDSPQPVEIDSKGLQGIKLRCKTSWGGESWTYDVWLIQKKKHPKNMLIIDLARRNTGDDKDLEEIERAIRGIKRR